MKKRLFYSIIAGAVLGVFCIVGISLRIGYAGNEIFVLATYYNRLLMGLVIGLAGGLIVAKKGNVIIRGAILGLIVSFALFLSTDFYDLPGFIAGIFYGVIIDYITTSFTKD